MNKDKVLSYLGLAERGKRTVSGELQTENAIKSFEACVVIIAKDASDNTRKKFFDKCSFYEVPVFEYGTKEILGHAIGKDMRSVVGVVDEGLAKQIITNLEMSIKLEDGNGGTNGEN